jgi:hypothetical protein
VSAGTCAGDRGIVHARTTSCMHAAGESTHTRICPYTSPYTHLCVFQLNWTIHKAHKRPYPKRSGGPAAHGVGWVVVGGYSDRFLFVVGAYHAAVHRHNSNSWLAFCPQSSLATCEVCVLCAVSSALTGYIPAFLHCPPDSPPHTHREYTRTHRVATLSPFARR